MRSQKDKPKSKPIENKPVPLAGWLLGLVLITVVAYSSLFSPEKEFTNWDDDRYVLSQPMIQGEEIRIKEIFDPRTAVVFNYHPITMLSLALDYRRGWNEYENELSMAPFARTNLLLHLFNTLWVFFFFYRLSENQRWLGLIPAILFALHPMHVESVAWISERKDLLYSFFFLLSGLAYLKYRKEGNLIFLLLSFLLFLGSALSKAMALPLPLVFFLIDYLQKRKWSLGMVMEKTPFLLAAVALGLLALHHQSAAMNPMEVYPLPERLALASYGYLAYLIKILFPYPLSAYYPYPQQISWYYYFLPLGVLFVWILPFRLRLQGISQRQWIWGMGFYTLMILLVLPFFSLGSSLMADRYSYLSYLGPFYLISLGIHQGWNSFRHRQLILGACIAYLILIFYLTFQQVGVWQNSRSLWSHVIHHFPFETHRHTVKTPYKNLGDYLASRQEYDSALHYYSLLAEEQVADAGIYISIGNIHALKNEHLDALHAYTLALQIDSSQSDPYLHRGLVHSKQNNPLAAASDLNRAIEKSPDKEELYRLRAKFMLDAAQYQENIGQIQEALKKFPQVPELWFYLAVSYMSLGDYASGIPYLNEAIERNPAPLYIYNLASAYYHLGERAKALELALKAKEMGFPVSEEFINKLSP